MSGDDDGIQDCSHVTPAYRRALWTVVVLNVGYGLAEIVAGFVSGSQALKADALDFLGDGTITLLGLLAIGWSLVWRARSALLQGIFLGLLGLGGWPVRLTGVRPAAARGRHHGLVRGDRPRRERRVGSGAAVQPERCHRQRRGHHCRRSGRVDGNAVARPRGSSCNRGIIPAILMGNYQSCPP